MTRVNAMLRVASPRAGRRALLLVLLPALVALARELCVRPWWSATPPRGAGLAFAAQAPAAGRQLLVIGGTGYVGSEVCKLALERGWKITAMSRRGADAPAAQQETLKSVRWVKGDAGDYETVKALVAESDAVVHAIGLLFDVDSGLTGMNTVVSGSGSLPGEDSTYDRITRQTAFNVIRAVKEKFRLPFAEGRMPLMFVSAAEAGWPEVTLGDRVEQVAPEWLKRYLAAKRAVEASLLESTDVLRPGIFRPSLVWSWTKFDVLPVIPIFNLASALGVPFVDKTVQVGTLAGAIVAGLEDDEVSGVQRFPEMEALAGSSPAR